MLRIKENGFTLLPDEKIIRRESYTEFVEGQSIVAAAKKEAERIVQEAHMAYEAEKKRGFEEGKEAGKLEISDHMVDYVTRIVGNLKSFEDKLVDMLMQSLRQIIGDIDKRELIVGVVGRALQVVRSQKRITIRVAPSDVDAVDESIKDYMERYPTIDFLDVSADDRLKSGDCILETDVGVVDARLDQQLDIIKKSLERWIK